MSKSRLRGERGAALVEFALIVPLFMMLVLGMFTGGIAYNTKITLTNASREASRYGATLPLANFGGTAEWLDSIAAYATSSSSGELAPGVDSRATCVAYVHPGSASGEQSTVSRTQNGSTGPTYGTAPCYADGQASSERRVQVVLGRTRPLEFLLVSQPLTLESKSSARFEATP